MFSLAFHSVFCVIMSFHTAFRWWKMVMVFSSSSLTHGIINLFLQSNSMQSNEMMETLVYFFPSHFYFHVSRTWHLLAAEMICIIWKGYEFSGLQRTKTWLLIAVDWIEDYYLGMNIGKLQSQLQQQNMIENHGSRNWHKH